MKEIFKQKTKVNLFVLLKYFLIFVLLYIFSSASIKGNIHPFAFGFYFALLWCEQDILITSGLFLLSNYLTFFSFTYLLAALFCVYIAIMFFLLHRKIKKPINYFLLAVYAVISQLSNFYFISQGEFIVNNIVSIFLGVLFMYVCLNIFKYLLLRGVSLKLTIDETMCLGVFCLVFALGISSMQIFNIKILTVLGVFFILLTTYVYNSGSGIICGVLFGLGYAINYNSFSYVAIFAIFGVVALAFKHKIRYFSVLAVLLCEVVFGLYFKIYESFSIFNVVAVAIGEVMFLLINNNLLKIIQIMLGGLSEQTAVRNVVNRSRDGLCKRMYEISDVFFEMNKVFRGLIKGVLPAQDACNMLIEEVQDKVCKDCPERHKCWRVLNVETYEVFSDIVSAGFERGKVLILDIPPFLSSRCNRITSLLSAINQLITSYKQYTTMVSNMDSSRVLVAEQLQGVSKLMRVLADETKQNVSFDISKENTIIEELNYKNIVCSEAVLYEQNKGIINLTLIVRTKDLLKDKIEKVASKICSCKMIITEIYNSTIEGFSTVELKTAPSYDIVFGCSGGAKFNNTVSGDTYSFLKLSNDKVLLGICDGMGNGQNAKITSDTAISLIENFYKAGFDNETVLSSVNKLLTLNADEKFSAIDLCIVDLNLASADFIKLGSPESILKRKDNIEILCSSALPLGILDEIKPTIIKKLINYEDMIILCSDGVVDSFSSVDEFSIFVNGLETLNPQVLSDAIMERVVQNYNNEMKDDCTVICARVFPRI